MGLMAALRDEVSQRIDAYSVATVAGLLYLSVVVFDAPLEQLGATAVGSGIAGSANVIADAYELQDGTRRLGLGLASLFGAIALFVAEGTVGLPAALGTVGVWLALDGAQSLRHAGVKAPSDQPPDGETVYRQYLARRIRKLLEQQPRSRTELVEAMDADESDVVATLESLRERDLIERQAGVYHRRSPARPDRLTRVRQSLEAGLRRFARPVAVEVAGWANYAGDETGAEPGEEPAERDRVRSRDEERTPRRERVD